MDAQGNKYQGSLEAYMVLSNDFPRFQMSKPQLNIEKKGILIFEVPDPNLYFIGFREYVFGRF